MDTRFDLDDEIDELMVTEFFDEYEDYVFNEMVPMAVAKYLALGFNKDFLSPCSITSHINSATDIFSIECEIDSILPKVEKILSEKYSLRIVDYQITKLEKINK